MSLAGLMGYITIMWIMILTVAAFLVMIVVPIDVVLFRDRIDRLITSIIQASIAIGIVLILIFALSMMKNIYMQRKL
ncbi:MAG: hypothetical protein WA421_16625 [Nitrososphaeraceae archaeon]